MIRISVHQLLQQMPLPTEAITPHLTLSVSPVISVESSSSEVDEIRPLLSPIVTNPDEPDTDPITVDRLLLIPGEDDDDFLLRSLKSASLSNTNLKSKQSLLSSSKTSLKRYKDNPNASTSTESQPYIFHPNNSRLLENNTPNLSFNTSNGASNNVLGENNHIQGQRRRSSITESIVSEVVYLRDLTLAQLKRRRFFVVCLFSLICIFIFNLIFLPRTTLDRDLRRLYGGFLTFDDVSRIFINQLSYNSNIENYIDLYNDRKHDPGKNHRSVELVMKNFKYLQTTVDSYDVFMSTPIDINIKLIDEKGAINFEPNLKESDELSHIPYSLNGEVTSEFIYVNYGLEDDYNLLKSNKIELKDKIFIIRLNKIHPSLLIESAQNNGANSIIFYNDPYDDGKFTEVNGYRSFPLGYARNHHVIDKYTGNFIFYQPGDPTTPGWSPYLFDNYKRLKDPKTVPKIPIISISFTELQPILKKVNKIGPTLHWSGNVLGFDYSPGPSKGYKLSIKNHITYDIKPIYNIMTIIPGIIPDEEIIIGSSRDIIGGYGGVSTGEISLVEIARGFNELVKRGWKPLRTVKLISWDGSSLGQLGSTEYGEYHAQRLIDNCIAYINLDDIRGTILNINSNPLFNKLLKRIMKLIIVDNNETLLDVFEYNNGTIGLIGNKIDDSAVFQNHLGIPSINVGFKQNSNTDPVSYYNSKFDNIRLLESFDPELNLHSLLGQFIGLLTIELSEREILDVSVSDYLEIIVNQFNIVSKMIPKSWMDKNMTYPFEFKTLRGEIQELETESENVRNASKQFDLNLKFLQEEILRDYPWFKLYKKVKTAIQIKLYNTKIKTFDRMFISLFKETDKGLLSKRPWFRHLCFAPNLHDSATTAVLPGLLEGLKRDDFEQFEINIISLHMALQRIHLAIQ
jgi:N-acetylated-alpha-linked acidic dipeptidase